MGNIKQEKHWITYWNGRDTQAGKKYVANKNRKGYGSVKNSGRVRLAMNPVNRQGSPQAKQ